MNQLDDVTVSHGSGRRVHHQLLSETHTCWDLQNPTRFCSGSDLPGRVLDDPPVVDVLEGVAGHLLLVGAAPPIFIPEHRNRKLPFCPQRLLIGCRVEPAAPDWIVGFVRVEPAGDGPGGGAS